jgi:hypothetical protein
MGSFSLPVPSRKSGSCLAPAPAASCLLESATQRGTGLVFGNRSVSDWIYCIIHQDNKSWKVCKRNGVYYRVAPPY